MGRKTKPSKTQTEYEEDSYCHTCSTNTVSGIWYMIQQWSLYSSG